MTYLDAHTKLAKYLHLVLRNELGERDKETRLKRCLALYGRAIASIRHHQSEVALSI